MSKSDKIELANTDTQAPVSSGTTPNNIGDSNVEKLFNPETPDQITEKTETPINNGWFSGGFWGLLGYKSGDAQISGSEAETSTNANNPLIQPEINISSDQTSADPITNSETTVNTTPKEIPASSSFLTTLWNILTFKGNREEANKEIVKLDEIKALPKDLQEIVEQTLGESVNLSVDDTMKKLSEIEIPVTGKDAAEKGETHDI